jgi:hypothetical protein
VAEQGYVALLLHHMQAVLVVALNALALWFPPKLSSHTQEVQWGFIRVPEMQWG